MDAPLPAIGNEVMALADAQTAAEKEEVRRRISHDVHLRPRLKHLKQAYRLVRGYIAKLYTDLEDLNFVAASKRLKPLLAISNR